VARLIGRGELASRDTVGLARWLIGKRLVAVSKNGSISQRITEAEAYDGPDDLACHASKGRTARTEVMFGPAGRWYVYLVYGMHEMLNIVTGPPEYPAAVLIRGLDGVVGPGRLTKALGIDRRFNGKAAARRNGLYIEDDGAAIDESKIQATPRIGVAYAGADWANRPYRFVWKAQRI